MQGEIMIIGLTLLVALVGVLMYALSSNPKLNEIGRLMFFAGLLAFLLVGARLVVDLAK
jgi:Na+/phosphate symporter